MPKRIRIQFEYELSDKLARFLKKHKISAEELSNRLVVENDDTDFAQIRVYIVDPTSIETDPNLCSKFDNHIDELACQDTIHTKVEILES